MCFWQKRTLQTRRLIYQMFLKQEMGARRVVKAAEVRLKLSERSRLRKSLLSRKSSFRTGSSTSSEVRSVTYSTLRRRHAQLGTTLDSQRAGRRSALRIVRKMSLPGRAVPSTSLRPKRQGSPTNHAPKILIAKVAVGANATWTLLRLWRNRYRISSRLLHRKLNLIISLRTH